MMTPSVHSEVARAEADDFLHRFLDRPEAALVALDQLAPEVRMLAGASLISAAHATPTPNERSRAMVALLMGGGDSTLGEIVSEIKTMSPEGRAMAFEWLTGHPDYKIKGTRWEQGPVSMDEVGRFSRYQIMIDIVRGSTDLEWNRAMSSMAEAKRFAARGEWADAARSAEAATVVLEHQTRTVSDFYRYDLAAAYFHLDWFRQASGDRAGGYTAINTAVNLLAQVEARSPEDPSVRLDRARALGNLAIYDGERGAYDVALRSQDAALEVLRSLAQFDQSEFGTWLAEAMVQRAMYLRSEGRVREAYAEVDRSIEYYGQLFASGVNVDQRFVAIARDLRDGLQAVQQPARAQPLSSPVTPELPPANWYADPHGAPGLLRYWDGAQWTEHTHAQV